MLVLSLTVRPGDNKIYLGDDICIVLLDIRGRQVKLGIEAPRELDIVRARVRHKREQERNDDSARPS